MGRRETYGDNFGEGGMPGGGEEKGGRGRRHVAVYFKTGGARNIKANSTWHSAGKEVF